MRVELLANPWSGKGVGPDRAERIAAELRKQGCRCQVFVGDSRQHSVDWGASMATKADRMVIVGGDGTLNAVCEGIFHYGQSSHVPTPPPLAMAALGTANLLASEFKLPRSQNLLAQLVLAGQTQMLDVGEILLHDNEQQDLHMQCALVWDFGLGGAVMKRMSEVRTGPIRKSHYFRLLHQVLRDWTPNPQRVIANGKDLGEFEYGIVSGIRTYAHPIFRFPACAYDDNLWELYLFRKMRRRLVPQLALAVATGRLDRIQDAINVRARRVEVHGGLPSPVQVDGDFAGFTPVQFRLPGHQLQVLCPPDLRPSPAVALTTAVPNSP